MICIATFYSHFAAIRYKKLCDAQQIPGSIMPVPRDLSSSCGTCVRYEGEPFLPEDSMNGELDQLVQLVDDHYSVIYRAENS